MSGRAVRIGLAGALFALFQSGVGCFGGGPRLLDPLDAGTAQPVDFGDAGELDARSNVDLGDPFAVLGTAPSHGPWSGGTRTVIRGRGFGSKMEIWIGGRPVDKSAIVASDPTRVAIVTPEGNPGPADVVVRNVATAEERTLVGGFLYDAYVVKPDTGAQTGGTHVRLTGRGTSFVAGTKVFFGGAECADVTVTSATELECNTPAGAIGPVEVVVKTPGAPDLSARDAFTYNDVFDPDRGGFSGGALSGNLRVNVLDGATGLPIPGAKVIAGETLATALVGTTGANGAVMLQDASLGPKITVTAAAKCHQPVTYVDVPVDTVSFYLSPVVDLSCVELEDPPSGGGSGFRNGGSIRGQLVWEGGVEFKRAGWWSVPTPVRPTERQAAYVFTAQGSSQTSFFLPAPSSATTPDSPGSAGYDYNLVVAPGNVTLYALAGIEDRSFDPPRFSAFAMGVARGVGVAPNGSTSDVDIAMNVLVDHRLSMTSQPPPTTVRGPDRLFSSLAVSVGPSLYAALPNGSQVHLLPFPGGVDFAPVPSLDGALAGEAYVVGAIAATTPQQTHPASIVSKVRVTDANVPVSLGGFLPVPVLKEPGANAFSGTNVEFTANGTYDLATISVESGSGMTSWTIIAPAGRSKFGLPDLSTFPDAIGLKRGPIRTTVTVARLEAGFAWEKLQAGNLASSRWTAQAWDSLTGSY